MEKKYENPGPSPEEISLIQGETILEFGVDWCGHCKGAAPIIEEALREAGTIRHIKVEDGSGRRLGRSFKVKLWPTLVFLKDGQELARVVRPTVVTEVLEALDTLR